MEEPLFSVPIKVRYYDTDLSQAVFFTNFIKWLDSIAFPEFIEELGIHWKALMEENVDVVVAHVSFDYGAPCFLDDLIDININEIEFGRSSMTLHGALLREETLLAAGKLVYVFVNLVTRKTILIPEKFKNKVSGHIEKIKGRKK